MGKGCSGCVPVRCVQFPFDSLPSFPKKTSSLAPHSSELASVLSNPRTLADDLSPGFPMKGDIVNSLYIYIHIEL